MYLAVRGDTKEELDAAEEQLALLDEAQQQSAVYRHDIRRHLTAISGLLSEGGPFTLRVVMPLSHPLP